MQIHLEGKIVGTRQTNDGRTVSDIMQPAADEYSSPNVFSVMSDNRIGDKDSVVSIMVGVRGWIRTAQYVDKQTGEQKTAHNQNVIMTYLQTVPSAKETRERPKSA